jgi:hypothetical protein
MDIEIIRRICLARHLYELSRESLKSANDLYLFSGVNLLQDAVEAFLVATADFVGASLDEKTNFDKYFVLINEKIAPKELSFKNRLLRLNKIRVNSKHHGIQPARDECQRLSIAVREFFDEVSSSILGVNFSTVSAIDLMHTGETKDLLLAAKVAFDNKDYAACAIDCRKAIYLELENSYDIASFKDDVKPRGLLGRFSKAPFFARSKDYIEQKVLEPTDYIVYDHIDLDQELLKYSIDSTDFWNVWRLTPEVYRTMDKEWVLKHDFGKLDKEILTDTIEYIFNTTVDILLAVHAKKESIKTSSNQIYYLELAKDEVPVYEKADRKSKIVCRTPKDLMKVDCDFYITGLQGDGPYWHVYNFGDSGFFIGFIHNEDVQRGRLG